MKTMQVRLPDTVHHRLRELAGEEGISLNQFIVTSVSNEIVRQETSDFFRAAAAKFDATAFADALSAVPDLPADRGDRLPSPSSGR
mgnify:CR=1 FL=1